VENVYKAMSGNMEDKRRITQMDLHTQSNQQIANPHSRGYSCEVKKVQNMPHKSINRSRKRHASIGKSNNELTTNAYSHSYSIRTTSANRTTIALMTSMRSGEGAKDASIA